MKYQLIIPISCLLAAPALAAPANFDDSSLSYDPSEEYIVLLHKAEQRGWNTVLPSIGYNISGASINSRSADGTQQFSTDTGISIRTFDSHIRGFTISMKRSEGEILSSHPNIAMVEKNHIVHSFVEPQDPKDVSQEITPDTASKSHSRRALNTRQKEAPHFIYRMQINAPWNLERISSTTPPSFINHRITDRAFEFRYPPHAGKGVDMYILDTGLNPSNPDFHGRASMLYSAFDDNGTDEAGHGTHIAGTAASFPYGVAKSATIHGVKVLKADGKGTAETFIKGINAAIKNHNKRKSSPDFKGSVLNLSLGVFVNSDVLKSVVRTALDAGIHIAAAAGNENRDTCGNVFPAGWSDELPVVSVGATDLNDRRAWFSNWGKCVSLFAPGVVVTSTSNNGASSVRQGTSVACPHVAGVIATELGRRPDLRLNPRGMRDLILSRGLLKVATPPKGQLLLNNGFD
ncbi:hypothetical protein H072_9396 [Dactylellina haptotyla CBS 200.50]|uniref:Peptidase S8/S53 domain-containing protein n=1 Tax=Dactylellina haptotyla (strain CBS 200.50) TaxID=1284197 RepID=S8A793_DACHA|nr:hypothetical protein H072_9396 [Dactylellina haptotyla CBS 200.50]